MEQLVVTVSGVMEKKPVKVESAQQGQHQIVRMELPARMIPATNQ